MKTYALYGLIYAVVTTILTLASYFLGFQTEHLDFGMYVSYAIMIIFMVVLFLGVKERREALPDQKMGFGAALGGAMMISLVAGILGAAYMYIHYSQIHPDFGDYMVRYQQAKMESAGMPDGMVEKITTDMAKGFTPAKQARNALIGSVVLGFILGLMLAPGQTQKGSLTRITIVNASIGGFVGLLGGAANGFMVKAVGSYALIGLVAGAAIIGGTTYLLLKLTDYTPRFADTEPPM